MRIVRAFGYVIQFKGKSDEPLFSERMGYYQPLIRVGPYRVFVFRDVRFK